jgi:DNA-binding LytR/AlgR family response regulator
VRLLILEDEPPAAAQLVAAVRAYRDDARVIGVAESVREAVRLLRAEPEPDLILADVRLADGLSFRVFDEVPVRCPVVFATAHDQHVIEAMEQNAIDYLLKPIQPARVAQALDKYVRLREHFRGRLPALAEALGHAGVAPPAHPARVLARRGAAFVAVPLDRVAWFTTEHKLTLLFDRSGARLVVDETLSQLAARLDPRTFFRLNRQILAHVGAVARFRGGGKGKVLVTLDPPADDEVVVSQEIAAAFRAWMAG